jgi:hypothetical protein
MKISKIRDSLEKVFIFKSSAKGIVVMKARGTIRYSGSHIEECEQNQTAELLLMRFRRS